MERHGFDDVLVALKVGHRAQRVEWSLNDVFVFMKVPARLNVVTVVPGMQSLPQSVKDEFKRRFDKTTKKVGNGTSHNHSTIDFSNQMCIVYDDNSIHGWNPSVEDMLADDWYILD